MKKLLLSCAGLLFGAQLTYAAPPSCGDGIATTKTWTNGTRDYKWETSGNWSPAGAPDCDDNVEMNTGFTCNIASNVVINDLVTGSKYNKRISIKGTGSLHANDITLNTGTIIGEKTNDTFKARNITMGSNTWIATNHAVITGTLSLGNSRFDAFSNATIDLQNLTLNNYATFRAPDGYSSGNTNAIVKIRGNIYKEPIGNLNHSRGLVRLIGNTTGTINTNNSTMYFHILEVDKKADGAGNIDNPAFLYVNNTLGAGKGSKLIAKQRLTLIEASFNSWSMNNQIDIIGSEDSVVVDTAMRNNSPTYYVGNNFNPHIAFTGSGSGVYIVNTPLKGAHNILVDKDNATDVVTVVNHQEIGWKGYRTIIQRGILAFDGSTNARINGGNQGLTVSANGQLRAPDDDTLFYNGGWNFANENSFDAQNGTFCMDNNASVTSLTHNNDTVHFNNFVVNMTNSVNPNNGTAINFSSGSDVIYIHGDITFPNTSRAYFGNVQLILEGNLTVNTPVSNGVGSLPEKITFAGSNNQTVFLSSSAKSQFGKLVVFDKTSGTITMASDWNIRAPYFKSGIVKTSGYQLTVTNPTGMTTGNANGNANSFVDGPLTMNRLNATSWSSSTQFPVGKGTTYGPIRLESIAGAGDSFRVEFFANGYSGDNTVNSPLDTVVASEHWKIVRLGGTSLIRAHVYNVRIPSGWTSTKQRVAYNYATSGGWINGGRSNSDASIYLRASNSINENEVYVAAAIDKDASAPMMVSEEGISGTEVATQRTKSAQLDNNGKPLVQFEVYPNPVANTLNMEVINADKGVVTVSDMTGKIFGTYNAAEVKSIDFSAFARGLYLVNFTDGLVNITHRISKN